MVKFQRGVWTLFQDTLAGGGPNLPAKVGKLVAIEAPLELAREVFRARFGNPDGSCACCGPNFLVRETSTAPTTAFLLQAKDGWLFP